MLTIRHGSQTDGQFGEDLAGAYGRGKVIMDFDRLPSVPAVSPSSHAPTTTPPTCRPPSTPDPTSAEPAGFVASSGRRRDHRSRDCNRRLLAGTQIAVSLSLPLQVLGGPILSQPSLASDLVTELAKSIHCGPLRVVFYALFGVPIRSPFLSKDRSMSIPARFVLVTVYYVGRPARSRGRGEASGSAARSSEWSQSPRAQRSANAN